MTDPRAEIRAEAQKLTKTLETARDEFARLGDMLTHYKPVPDDRKASRVVCEEVGKTLWKMSHELLPFAIVVQLAIVLFKEDAPSHEVPPSPDGNPPAHIH